jgi:hypothetical protein
VFVMVVFVIERCVLEMICLLMNSAVIDGVRKDFLDSGGWLWNLLSVIAF